MKVYRCDPIHSHGGWGGCVLIAAPNLASAIVLVEARSIWFHHVSAPVLMTALTARGKRARILLDNVYLE